MSTQSIPLSELHTLIDPAIHKLGISYGEAAERAGIGRRMLEMVRRGERPGRAADVLRSLGYTVRTYAEVEPAP